MTNGNRTLALSGVLAAISLVVSQAAAQMGPGMGFGRGCSGTTSETIHGTIQSVQNNASFCRWGGTEVVLKTDKGTVNVVLGPTAFLTQNNFAVATGDELTVTGFNLTSQGAPYLIAGEVTKAGNTLTLRDTQGFPAWAGRGMGWRAGGGWRGGCGCPRCGGCCRGW